MRFDDRPLEKKIRIAVHQDKIHLSVLRNAHRLRHMLTV